MPAPLLVIVTGPPAAGKTTLGRRIADALHLPFIYRDGIKESLFDGLGCADLAWSRRLGAVSYDLLYHVAEAILRAGGALVLESNFDPDRSVAPLRRLITRTDARLFQIVCFADPEVLEERYRQRAAAGERHPGHTDHIRLNGDAALLSPGLRWSLPLDGERVEIDTTDFAAVDYGAVFAAVARFLEAGHA